MQIEEEIENGKGGIQVEEEEFTTQQHLWVVENNQYQLWQHEK